MSSSEEQKIRLLARVRAEPSPVRDEVVRRDRAQLALAMPGIAAAVLFASGVHVTARPYGLVVASSLAWALLATVATSIALFRGRSMLGAPRGVVLGAAFAAAPLLAATWFSLPWAEITRSLPHSMSLDATCFVLTVALAAGPLVLLVRVRSEGDPVHPGVTGAIAGAAAGAWGATLVDLHCELLDPMHVVLAHILPVALLLALGAAWGRARLAVRVNRRV